MLSKFWRTGARTVAALAAVLTSTSCGDLTREGTSPAFLMVTNLVAASGAEPGKFGGTLYSDVQTLVKKDDVFVPTIFSDLGQVTFKLAMKDAGTAANPVSPTSANFITLDRYHVEYSRSDGRNTAGVDVPYGFDGAMTFTVEDSASQSFELVRHVAKQEAPLASLRANGTIIATIANITFYGHDQTGRSVSTKSSILVEFGNFGDPE